MDGYYTNMRVRFCCLLSALTADGLFRRWLAPYLCLLSVSASLFFCVSVLQVPFYKSIRLTAQLPAGHAPFSVCASQVLSH